MVGIMRITNRGTEQLDRESKTAVYARGKSGAESEGAIKIEEFYLAMAQIASLSLFDA